MNKPFFIASTLAAALLASALLAQAATLTDQLNVYLAPYATSAQGQMQNGTLVLKTQGHGDLELALWNVPGVPRPTAEELSALDTSPEVLAALAAAEEDNHQAAKPAERKLYENAFILLCDQLLVLAGDERAGAEPPEILGTGEIMTLVENLPAESELAGLRLSLKILAVDSALKRFDPLWWDDAAWHPEVAE